MEIRKEPRRERVRSQRNMVFNEVRVIDSVNATIRNPNFPLKLALRRSL